MKGSKYELTVSEQKAVNDYLESKGLPTWINLTFADLIDPCLASQYSEIRTRSAIFNAPESYTTELSPTIKIKTPLIAANMECVTDVDMVVAIEREGGLGIIPQMLSLESRLEKLERIARHQCAFIADPLTIEPNKTLLEAEALMAKFGINGLIVVEGKKPVGILSHRDWRHEKDKGKLVSELMGGGRLRELKVALAGISFDEAAKILYEHRIEKLPLVNGNGELVGLHTASGIFYKEYYPRASRDENGQFLKVGSIGVGEYFTDDHLRQVAEQVEKGICLLMIDTARSNAINAVEALVAIKNHFPMLEVMIGNIDTPEGAKALFENGADIIKVGIGPGDSCRTREVGIGLPQVSAIAKCAAIAKFYNKCVVGDGGMKMPGDVAKTIIAGAHAAMSGYLFIRTEEAKAESEYIEGGPAVNNELIKVKKYIGSSSYDAQKQRVELGNLKEIKRPEGVSKWVPVICTVEEQVNDILWGLASAMSYLGVWNLKELREKTRFELQTKSGLIEGIKRQ